uniref:Short coiled-coil protein n=55 Tax=Amniota TaxID=32524 RepID=A0A6I8PHR9_ORNAN
MIPGDHPAPRAAPLLPAFSLGASPPLRRFPLARGRVAPRLSPPPSPGETPPRAAGASWGVTSRGGRGGPGRSAAAGAGAEGRGGERRRAAPAQGASAAVRLRSVASPRRSVPSSSLPGPERRAEDNSRVQLSRPESSPSMMMNADMDAVEAENQVELEEKTRLINQVLELQHTLEDLSARVDAVKEENLKLKSENQVLGQYIENLMSASSVFQTTDTKSKRK